MIKSLNSESRLIRQTENQTIENSVIATELVKRYKEDCEMKGMSTESVRRYLSSINISIQYLNDNGLDLLSVDRELLRNFLEYLRKTRAVSYNTLKNYFSALSNVIRVPRIRRKYR